MIGRDRDIQGFPTVTTDVTEIITLPFAGEYEALCMKKYIYQLYEIGLTMQ